MKEKEEKNNLDLYFCGDVHGEFSTLVWNITQRYNIRDANVIVVGDCGIGFCKERYYDTLFNHKLKNKLDKNNINLFFLRGNHDCPDGYWRITEGMTRKDYGRVKFIEDHKVFEISGVTIYPIGGAISIDREERIQYNKKKASMGSKDRIYWPSECIDEIYSPLPNKVDVIISHTAPMSFLPITTRAEGMSKEIYQDIVKERTYLDYVLREVRCDKWIYSHFHESFSGSIEGVLYKCLDILELFKYIKYE